MKTYIVMLFSLLSLMTTDYLYAGDCPGRQTECSGIWKFTFGVPERITPVSTRFFQPEVGKINAMACMPDCPRIPYQIESERGMEIHIPLSDDEMLYGLGLQMKSFQLRGTKKILKVNADPEINSGDSHAPVPFYVSNEGYGIFINTARNLSIYFGTSHKKDGSPEQEVIIDIPVVSGVEVYVFGGPTMKDAIARYNLYSGGGVVPPVWGLGFWYRPHLDFTQDDVEAMALELRKRDIPCDVIGLEPGWQTASYSCSYLWNKNFPNPKGMMHNLSEQGFKVNLWQHAFVASSSPLYEKLMDYSGDYMVWNGLVPDFLLSEARRIYGDYMYDEIVSLGVSGFKGDECDNSDYTGNWSFPEFSKFPSGADGEQMHSLFGMRYQDAMLEPFNKTCKRTYGLVRNSGALAAHYPFVLYSDLYNHRDFINTTSVAGFSGLLWTPEVRHAENAKDLIRRLQSTVVSPLAMVNAWYMKGFPWKQTDKDLNNSGQYFNNWQEIEEMCRTFINLRMQLIPYLHSSFVEYAQKGIPPFRALVVDYPDDPNVFDLPGQYMMGESMMAVPLTAETDSVSIYFPEGEWVDFFTGQHYQGHSRIEMTVPLDRIPLFVKSGAVVPLAHITESTEDKESKKIEVRVYGKTEKTFVLYDDDGTVNAEYYPNTITVNGKKAHILKENGHKSNYVITGVQFL